MVGKKSLIGFFGVVLLIATAMSLSNGVSVAQNGYLKFVSGTEYWSGEEGQCIIRITNFKGNPLNADCNATLVYPNKTIWVENQSMTASAIAGNYYYSFTTPETEGIYEEIVNCTYTIGTQRWTTISSSFHVSPPLNFLKDLNTTIIDINTSVNEINATTHQLNWSLYEMNQTLMYINQTTTNTYDYLTGTIASYLFNITASLSNINQTIVHINETTETIKTDIEDYAHVSILS